MLFLLNMLPIWYLAFYARPSGDDYGYSALIHAAWLDTHSLIEVLKAAGETVRNSYISWDGGLGNHLSFFADAEGFYPLFLLDCSVYYDWLGDCVICTLLLLLAAYQFIPSTAIGMYWYAGSAHYMLPHAAGLLGLAWISDYMRTGRRIRLVLLTFILSTIEISLGPATIRYFLFLIFGALSILYCEGWMAVKIKEKMGRKNSYDKEEKKRFTGKQYRVGILFPGLALAALFLLCNREWMRTCVDREAIEYVTSGQAEDFRDQINSQMEILLDDSIKEAYLVPINPEQGPLMHMPVTTDENAFTNRVVRDFYRKEKVVMLQ